MREHCPCFRARSLVDPTFTLRRLDERPWGSSHVMLFTPQRCLVRNSRDVLLLAHSPLLVTISTKVAKSKKKQKPKLKSQKYSFELSNFSECWCCKHVPRYKLTVHIASAYLLRTYPLRLLSMVLARMARCSKQVQRAAAYAHANNVCECKGLREGQHF